MGYKVGDIVLFSGKKRVIHSFCDDGMVWLSHLEDFPDKCTSKTYTYNIRPIVNVSHNIPQAIECEKCRLNHHRDVIRKWAENKGSWYPSNDQCDALLAELGIAK